MLAKAIREREPPLPGLEAALDGRVEEQLVLGAEILLGRGVAGGVHAGGQIVARVQVPADHRIAEEGVDALAGLAHDRARLEALAEDAGGIVEQLRFGARATVYAACTAPAACTAHAARMARIARVTPRARMVRAAEGGRRPDADQLPGRDPEPDPQAPDEAGEVRPLGAVEGMQLVDHQVAQRVRPVVPPEPEVEGPDQEVVQHLVVREQDVGRPFAEGVAVRDDVVPAHRGVRGALRPVVAPDEEPRRDLAAE